MKKRVLSFFIMLAIIFSSNISFNSSAGTKKMRGDVNGDSVIDVKDVLSLRKYLVNPSEKINLDEADCDTEIGINTKDIVALRKYLAGLGTLKEYEVVELNPGWNNYCDWETDSSSAPVTAYSADVYKKALSLYPIKNELNSKSEKALSVIPYNSFSNPTITTTPTVIKLNQDVVKNISNLRMSMCFQDKENSDTNVINVGIKYNKRYYYHRITLENYSKFGYFYFVGKEYLKMGSINTRRTYLSDENIEKITLDKDMIKTIQEISIWFEGTQRTNPLMIDDIDYFIGEEGYDSTKEDEALPQPKEPVADGTKKYLCITFDDGPQTYELYGSGTSIYEHKHYMDMLLDLAEEYNAKFSFFIIGNQLGNDDIPVLQRAVALGSDLQNHTWDHPYLNGKLASGQYVFSDELMKAQLSKVDDWLSKNIGVTTTMLRPPMLAMDSKTYQTLDTINIAGIGMNDYSGTSVDYRMEYLKNNLKDGAIALIHENYVDNVETVRRLLEYYSKRGYEFVTVSEMFKIKNVTPVHDKMYNVIG